MEKGSGGVIKENVNTEGEDSGGKEAVNLREKGLGGAGPAPPGKCLQSHIHCLSHPGKVLRRKNK